jgi:hypothetical protein
MKYVVVIEKTRKSFGAYVPDLQAAAWWVGHAKRL